MNETPCIVPAVVVCKPSKMLHSCVSTQDCGMSNYEWLYMHIHKLVA